MAKNKQQTQQRTDELTPQAPAVKTIRYMPVPKFGACPQCVKTNTTTT